MLATPQSNVTRNTANQYLSITDIRIDGGTQSRAELNEEVIAEYAEAMSEGVVFPSLLVFYDGQDYWLADGFHRLHAALKAKLTEMLVEVRQGSRREAVLYSVGANANHGLRRTIADKRRAVLVLLNDPEWIGWSNREIAKQCGVTEKLVRNLKEELNQLSASGTQIAPNYVKKCGVPEITIREVQQRLLTQSQERTACRNGKTYTLDTAKIGSSTNAAQPHSVDKTLEETPASSTPGTSEIPSDIEVSSTRDSTDILLKPDSSLSAASAKTFQPDLELNSCLITETQLSPQDLVKEPKSRHKQLLPSLPPNPDVSPNEEDLLNLATATNTAAIASIKPDVVAIEISIGMKSLTPEQLAWTLNNAANNGLSDNHLKAIIKTAKRALNLRHHPEYFRPPSKLAGN